MLSLNLTEGALSELLESDDLVLMIDRCDGLRNMILKLKETFEHKGLKVKLGKTNLKVSSGIT